MARITAFIFLVSVLTGCGGAPDPEPIKVSAPPGSSRSGKGTIMVSIDNQQQLYIGTQKIDSSRLDSLLVLEINKFRAIVDTPTLVINADTSAWYGTVYRIMKLGKINGAKVVATVR